MSSTVTSAVALDTIDFAVDELRRGHAIVVIDDEGRENEGDFVFAASLATPELMAFLVRYSSGYVCAPADPAILDRLDLPLMVPDTEDPLRTAYTVSVDARTGVGTGISATDRAHTVRALAAAGSTPDSLIRPGHILPLRAVEGGVLARQGHTEATIDLLRLAGLPLVGVIGEVVNDDGTLMRSAELREFSDTHGLAMVSIEALIETMKARQAPN